MNPSLSDEEAEQLLVGHEDNKGNINYENFVRYIIPFADILSSIGGGFQLGYSI